jgi:hypothetical protein
MPRGPPAGLCGGAAVLPVAVPARDAPRPHPRPGLGGRGGRLQPGLRGGCEEGWEGGVFGVCVPGRVQLARLHGQWCRLARLPQHRHAQPAPTRAPHGGCGAPYPPVLACRWCATASGTTSPTSLTWRSVSGVAATRAQCAEAAFRRAEATGIRADLQHTSRPGSTSNTGTLCPSSTPMPHHTTHAHHTSRRRAPGSGATPPPTCPCERRRLPRPQVQP